MCEVKLEKLGKALERAHEDPEVGIYTPAAELLERGTRYISSMGQRTRGEVKAGWVTILILAVVGLSEEPRRPKIPTPNLLSAVLLTCKSPPTLRTLKTSLGTQLVCLALAKHPSRGCAHCHFS